VADNNSKDTKDSNRSSGVVNIFFSSCRLTETSGTSELHETSLSLSLIELQFWSATKAWTIIGTPNRIRDPFKEQGDKTKEQGDKTLTHSNPAFLRFLRVSTSFLSKL
jgi:hypothetical protein